MRRSIQLVLIPLLALFLGMYQDNGPAEEPVGKITFPLNRVFVISKGSNTLKYAQFEMDVFAGDKIETKKESRCEITLVTGDVIRIDENSIFTLEELNRENGEVQAQSFLNLGKLWANIRKVFSEDDYFKVKSPSAVIAVRGTIYRIDANSDASTEVHVYDGEVGVTPAGGGGSTREMVVPQRLERPQQIAPPQEVQGPEEVSVEKWLQIVAAQQRIVVRPDGSYERSEFDAAADANLEWVAWNRRRDELLGRRPEPPAPQMEQQTPADQPGGIVPPPDTTAPDTAPPGTAVPDSTPPDSASASLTPPDSTPPQPDSAKADTIRPEQSPEPEEE